MVIFDAYSCSVSELRDRISEISNKNQECLEDRNWVRGIPGFIDLTSLNNTDNRQDIATLCRKALKTHSKDHSGVPAVCIYSTFLGTAREVLKGSGVKLAAVAGCFPTGQSPLSLKLAEIKYALENGADEIDMVINRGSFLSGDHEGLKKEVSLAKEACGPRHLKVILETGELGSPGNIRKASELALMAGADFLKTSTGKSTPAATPEAALVMIDTIKEFHLKTGKKAGFKPAGGISTPEHALQYYGLVRSVLGVSWLTPDHFRIGASRLLDAVLSQFE